jgi:hypothetical protein
VQRTVLLAQTTRLISFDLLLGWHGLKIVQMTDDRVMARTAEDPVGIWQWTLKEHRAAAAGTHTMSLEVGFLNAIIS